MKRAIPVTVVVLFVFFVFFSPFVLGIGLSPPQLRLENAPMGEKTKVATIVITNTNQNPSYFIFKVTSLEENRPQKLRVICNGCHRDVGIQRGDLVNGSCPFCGSKNLIFYDFPPDDVLKNISLGCEEYSFHVTDGNTYVSDDKIQPKESIDVDIYVNIADVEENYGKHWEARIMATAVDDLDNQGMITYGAESKFLIDTPIAMEETVGPPIAVSVVVYLVIGAACTVIVCVVLSVHWRKTERREPKATVRRERKIL